MGKTLLAAGGCRRMCGPATCTMAYPRHIAALGEVCFPNELPDLAPHNR